MSELKACESKKNFVDTLIQHFKQFDINHFSPADEEGVSWNDVKKETEKYNNNLRKELSYLTTILSFSPMYLSAVRRIAEILGMTDMYTEKYVGSAVDAFVVYSPCFSSSTSNKEFIYQSGEFYCVTGIDGTVRYTSSLEDISECKSIRKVSSQRNLDVAIALLEEIRDDIEKHDLERRFRSIDQTYAAGFLLVPLSKRYDDISMLTGVDKQVYDYASTKTTQKLIIKTECISSLNGEVDDFLDFFYPADGIYCLSESECVEYGQYTERGSLPVHICDYDVCFLVGEFDFELSEARG